MCEHASQSQRGFSSKEIQEPHHAAAEHSSVEHIQQDPDSFHNGVATDNAAQPSAPDRPDQEHDSSFLRLPSELRLAIYDFALQDTLDDTIAQDKASSRLDRTSEDNPEPLPFIGALAILHTSRALRTEGVETMRSLAEAKRDKLDDALVTAYAKMRTFPVRGTSEEISETRARRDAAHAATRAAEAAVDGSERLVQTIHKVAHAEVLSRLSRLGVEFPWSEMSDRGKHYEIAKWCMTLTRADRASLFDGNIEDHEACKKWLVQIVDSGVEMRSEEE